VALVNRKKEEFSPVLIVTADSPAGVMRAVRKLIGGVFDDPGTFAAVPKMSSRLQRR
jgi:hypothetical protein